MATNRIISDSLSDFLLFLSDKSLTEGDRVPPLSQLSQQLGVSIAILREQMEVARTLGFIEVKPKTGIRRLPYSFRPAVCRSVGYAIASDASYFKSFLDLRNKVEAAFWYQAVELLTKVDHTDMQDLVSIAFTKLNGKPIHNPHREHKALHLKTFSRLNNPFVAGILEAYWDIYEVAGLDVYKDYEYLVNVWQYHKKIVDAIVSMDFTLGYETLIEHKGLLNQRSKVSLPDLRFE